MRIAIYGAGAIGGYLGARFSLAGEDVTLIARGPHLAAMQEHGLRLRSNDGSEETAHPRAVEAPEDAGPQDYVFLTLKAHQLSEVADRLPSLIGNETTVVTAQNGVPWWYFYGVPVPLAGWRLETVDPGGVVWDAIGPQRVIACVVYPATEIEEPGVVRHIDGNRFSLGELDGSKSERTGMLAQTLIGAGMRAPVRPRIRNELWVKLWGNVAFNPISAITGQTLAAICADPETRAQAREAMIEAQQVAIALGEKFRIDVDQRIEGAAAVGEHKTSMLQDVERGRRTEVDAIVGAVAELGRIVGVATPQIDSLYAQVQAIDERAGVR
jgi:2-dehydropantoate 2-reductase